jgi:hypothetical protein
MQSVLITTPVRRYILRDLLITLGSIRYSSVAAHSLVELMKLKLLPAAFGFQSVEGLKR